MNVFKKHTPETPEFFSAETELKMPKILICGDENTIKEVLKKDFNYTQPEDSKRFYRHHDEVETTELEESLLQVIRFDLLQAEDNLDRVKAEAKKMVDEAKASYSSEVTKQRDLTYDVNHGRIEMNIVGEKVFKIPAFGNFYYYILINEKLICAKVVPIITADQATLFSAQVENQIAVMQENNEKAVV